MSLLVLCDPRYRNNVWCDTKLRGIMDEAVRRRIQPEIFTDIEVFKASAAKLDADSSVILLFDSLQYICCVSELLRGYRIHPILSVNNLTIPIACPYSLVGGDTEGAMRTMVDYLDICGKHRIAMVGVNRDSCNDSNRAEMLRRYLPQDAYRIFYIENGFRECYDAFAAEQESFDAVICTNDHVAIRLIEHLKQYPRKSGKLFVLSHTDTVMARLYGEGLTSMTTNFYACGRAAVEAHFNRIKYGWENARILLPVELKVRGSTDFVPYTPASVTRAPNDFTVLPVSAPTKASPDQLSRLERVLAISDLADLKLMYCMLSGYSYEKMGEFCFLSADTARYRVRKIRDALGVLKKADAATILCENINKESLLAVIREMEGQNKQIPL